ncbi:beta-lactamase/transpeptidase-like protein [Linnemannia elongata]|nr:beta-lactamase/transpeptidase-like protein [Linnemannia elongata]
MSHFLLSKSSRLLFRSSFTHPRLLHHRGSISLARTISTTTSSADIPAANPSSAFLNNLPAILEKARVDGGIPGMSVAIMYKGEIVFAQGFGKRNLKDPFTIETVSHIASVTKAFTATAIGELVAEGKVDWDKTPVSEYLPEFQLKDPILTSQLTFADMLSHRTPVPTIDFAWFRSKEATRTHIKQLRHLDLPSSKLSPTINYNNIIYAVAGEAAANVTGMSYRELISVKLFEPLEFRNAGLSQLEMSKHPDFAMPYDAATFEDARNGIHEEGYIDEIPMADAPAGDIYMNVMDLAKWGRIILKEGELDGKQILNKESIQETLKPHNIVYHPERRRDFGPTTGYGLGWMLDSYKGRTIIQHGGCNAGYRSNLAFYPDDDLVVAHLANIYITELPTNLPYYIADGLLDLPKTTDWMNEVSLNTTQETYDTFAMIRNGDLPEHIDGKPCNHELIAYVGDYVHPVHGKVTVTLQEDDNNGGILHMRLRTLESKLNHYHYETFKGYVHDFTLKGNILFTFQTCSKGDVDAIHITIMGSDPTPFKKMDKVPEP